MLHQEINRKKNVLGLIRKYIGVTFYDFPLKMTKALGASHPEKGVLPWIKLCNRGENLSLSEKYTGVKCNWKGGSDLYLPKVAPSVGRWLFKRAISDFPIRYEKKPEDGPGVTPIVSFIIGHRGTDRLPLLLKALETIAAQKDCPIECIVVEQDYKKKIKAYLPSWVQYIHAPLDDKATPFSRSRAFNIGAKAASSEILILHDGDMLAPYNYAAEVTKQYRDGFDFINLKRFIFYLKKESSELILHHSTTDIKPKFDAIVQNLIGGASLAISCSAYEKIGGFDERFEGWGYEDIEFMDRTRTLKSYPYDYMPFIHLWHAPQKGKWSSDAPGLAVYKQAKTISVENRIAHLRRVNRFE